MVGLVLITTKGGTMIKKRLCIMLSAIACICMGLVAFIQLSQVNVDTSAAVSGYSVTDFKMLDKGSVRKNLDQNGIRFATFIGDESAQAAEGYWDSYEMGTLFIPKIAMQGNQELTIDGQYSGLSPIIAKFDGDVSRLQQDSTYTGGKLFNAVLELTEFTSEKALNGAIVARTYIKNKTTQEVTYCPAVQRAPAAVAATALDAGEEDTNGTLSAYVSNVAIGEVENQNILVDVNYILNTSVNVDGLSLKYTSDKGTISGNQFVPDSSGGLATVTVSTAGGKISKTFKIAMLKHEELARQYYAEKDANEIVNGSTTIHRNENSEYMSFNVCNVDKITYNGKLLLEDYDYVLNKNTNTVDIEKATLVAGTRVSNVLKFESAKSGNVSINVKTAMGLDLDLPSSVTYNSTKRFDLYSYYSVRDPEVTVDSDGNLGGTLDTYDSGIDFYDSKYISEYYDAGMEYLLGQSAASIGGLTQTLDTATDLKRTLDTAHELGKDNSVIVTDGLLIDIDRLNIENNYSTLTNKDIADGKYPTFVSSTPGDWQYSTVAEFDAKVESALSRYMDHPAFGGVMLRDEPNSVYLPLVAEIYQSVQRIFKKHNMSDKKIIVNFNPFYGYSSKFPYVADESETGGYQQYKAYIDLWLTLSGSKEVQMDIYSLYTFGIYKYHLVNLQMAAEVAAKHGAKISLVNSAWQRMKGKDNPDERFHTYQDMNYMANVAMAYGSMNLSYYMYHACNDTTG